jgi:hypothetical protein
MDPIQLLVINGVPFRFLIVHPSVTNPPKDN